MHPFEHRIQSLVQYLNTMEFDSTIENLERITNLPSIAFESKNSGLVGIAESMNPTSDVLRLE